jgi:hypothetical protein
MTKTISFALVDLLQMLAEEQGEAIKPGQNSTYHVSVGFKLQPGLFRLQFDIAN